MQADSSLPSLPRAQSVCFIRWCNRLLNNRQTWYELSYLSLCRCLHVEESCCIFHSILTALQLAICHCPLLEKHEQLCQAEKLDWKFVNVSCYCTYCTWSWSTVECSTTGTAGALCPSGRAGCHPLLWPSSLFVSVGFQGGQNLAVEGNIRPELPTFAPSPMLHIRNMVRIFENSFLPKAKFSESTP